MKLETGQISDQHFTVSGPRILWVEGVFLFRKELQDESDAKIWLQIEFEDVII